MCVNINLFIKRLIGTWVIQSNFYPKYELNKKKIGLNSKILTKWCKINIDNCPLDVQNNIKTKYIHLYKSYFVLKRLSDKIDFEIYYVFLFKETTQEGLLVKISKHSIELSTSYFYYTNNYVVYNHKLDKNTNIIEEIYFLNDKLRLTKSYLQKQTKIIAIYFCSGIKVS